MPKMATKAPTRFSLGQTTIDVKKTMKTIERPACLDHFPRETMGFPRIFLYVYCRGMEYMGHFSGDIIRM